MTMNADPVAPPPPPSPDATLVERERAARIRQAGRALRIAEAATERFVADGVDANLAFQQMLAHAEQREVAEAILPARISGGVSYDDPAVRRAAMSDALAARITRSAPPDHARAYAEHSLLEIARECLERAGERGLGRSPDQIWTRVAAYHTTSDFAAILAEASNKSLRRFYETAPSGIRAAARQTTAPDFRTIHRISAGEFPLPSVVGEHGEYKRGSMGDATESYSLATYGVVFAITRKAIINDDLGAFTDLARKAAVSSAEFVASTLAALVTANPVMGDGTSLFHANHGNLATAGGPPSTTTIGTARAAMRAQRGLDGVSYVRADPRYLIVPAAEETAAEQALATISAATAAEAPVFAGRLQVLVEPRLPADHWYLAADPAQIDGLEYAFLDGSPGPQLETRLGFDIDGVETRLRIDFGAGWIDFRSWQKIPSAAPG